PWGLSSALQTPPSTGHYPRPALPLQALMATSQHAYKEPCTDFCH
ncbi:hypothetical protein Nmel_000811, partial [Mimus melanotis]